MLAFYYLRNALTNSMISGGKWRP